MDTNNTDGAALLPVTPEGPRITVKASCFNCPFVLSESYRVQSDSGSNVYCAHPSFEKRQRVGDTVWDTPDFCPVIDIPAIRARVQPHSLPGDRQEDVDYWNEVANRLGHESVCEALEKLDALQSAASLPGDVGELRDRIQRARDSAGTHFTTLRNETADAAIAALTPSALSGDAGEEQ